MTDPQLMLDLHRHFNAPRDVVYQAFTDEDQLAVWFGPIGVSALRETVSVDAKVGGHRRLTVVSYNGLRSWSIDSTFSEVIENKLLAGYENLLGIPEFEDVDPFTFSIEFVDEGGGTRIEWCGGPYSPEAEVIAREGILQSFTKLDALLAG
ncbi:MAG: SRPBCC domain-containing protein [Actinomycetota bacterium]|nr:SRPBCC domain-containing protein [Actinomycetota bacterium]